MSDKPVFDFSQLTWGDMKSLARAQAMIKRADATGDDELAEAGFKALQEHLARCVKFIPPSWVVGGEALDWSSPASFDRLRASKMTELLISLAEAQRSENASGN